MDTKHTLSTVIKYPIYIRGKFRDEPTRGDLLRGMLCVMGERESYA